MRKKALKMLDIILVAVFLVAGILAVGGCGSTEQKTGGMQSTILEEDEKEVVQSGNEEVQQVILVGGIDINQNTIPQFIKVESYAVPEVREAVCLKVGSPYALVFHEQRIIDKDNKSVTPVVSDGDIYIPLEFVAEAFGAKIAISEVRDAVEFFGTAMISLSDISPLLKKNVFLEEDMGLIILSDNEINFTKGNDLDKMIDIMHGFVFERPSREQIAEDILKTSPNHPRVLATSSDFERIRTLVATDEAVKEWFDNLLQIAEKYVALANEGEAKPIYAADEGGRLANDYNIEERATSLGMAWQITGDQKYVDAMWYILEDICDSTKWECWHPGHFLDAATMMRGVAVAYDWMFDAWTVEQRKVIEDALYDCGIEDSLTGYYGATDYRMPQFGFAERSGWWKKESNWNAACNSGVLMAGAALATHEEYGDLAVKAMDFAIQAVEVGTRLYAPDGGYEEGVSYWYYGTEKLVRLIATLETAAGSTYGLADAPGFKDTYADPLFNESKQGFFNYHDGSITRSDTSTLFWFSRINNDPNISAIRYNELLSKEKLSSYMDILWYNPSNRSEGAKLSLDYNFFLTNTATMRSSWVDDYQLFVGLHGCNNDAGHAHLDAGTFVLDALDTRWFIDLGSENYNLPGYWDKGEGGTKWRYYALRAEGHNTIVINPDASEDQSVTGSAKITEFVSEPKGAYAKIDLTNKYITDVSKATRGFMLGANRTEVVIQDEIKMRKPSEFYWFGHTKADIEVAADGRSVILTQESKKLYAEIVSDNEDLKFSVMDAVSLPTSPQTNTGTEVENSREGIKKLVITASAVEEINMAIVFKPFVSDEVPECEYTYTYMTDWSIPEGERVIPRLESISVAGEVLKDFNKNVTGYEVILPADTESVPEIQAVADSESDYMITLPKQLPGTASIQVINKADDTISTTYMVFMRAAMGLEVEASDWQSGNPPENCLDKNLDTRWAVEGQAWGVFRFSRPQTISSVWVAFWKSSERQQIFSIEVSEDGENFTQVWSGRSTVTEDILEEFKIPEGAYKAVKLVLHGTTTGNWNSVLEVEFLS